MTILGSAQTYVGVLATFLVLCLFNRKSNNFLLSIILDIGNDTIKVLNEYAVKLKIEIHSIYENKEKKSKSGIGQLVNKAFSISPDLANRLLRNRNTTRILENTFFNEAMEVRSLFVPKTIINKPELSYIALLTLVLILVVMLVDVMEIFSVGIRSLFVNCLIVTGSVYSILLYRNFFMKEQIEKEGEKSSQERFQKPRKYIMLMGVFLSFLLWSLSCLFINEPLIACLFFPLALLIGFFLTKKQRISVCDKYQRYDRTFVLKHSIYIVLFALSCTIIIYFMTSCSTFYNYWIEIGFEENLKDWNNTMLMMHDANKTKYVVLFFFTLNTFIVPLLVGYIYLKREERMVAFKMNEVYKEYKNKVQKYEEDFKIIEREIEQIV